MEELLTPEMKAVIAELGEIIKADPRHQAIRDCIEEYERSEELNNLIAEYNMQQNALADAYGKNDEAAETLRTAVQSRIDALYDQITTHPVYTAYVEAKQTFDALTSEVFGELQFVITGQRPCSHNCASCHSDCGHQH